MLKIVEICQYFFAFPLNTLSLNKNPYTLHFQIRPKITVYVIIENRAVSLILRCNELGEKLKVNKCNERNGKIDLLKFIFAVVVALFHFSCSAEYPDEMFRRGYLSVEFFFIVSGYLFAKSLQKYDGSTDVLKDSIAFMKKKYISFFPYHIFVCILTFIGWILYYNYSLKEYIIKVLQCIPDMLLLQMFGIRHMNWMLHEWYLSAMLIAMFVITPIMIKYRKLYSYYIAPVVSLAILGFLNNNYESIDLTDEWNGFICAGTLRAFAGISLGCVCFAFKNSGVIERLNRKLLILLEISAYATALFYMNKELNTSLEYSMIFILMLGIVISFSDKAAMKFLNNRFVYFLGKLSLPLYLCHIIIRNFVVKLDWKYGYWTHMLLFLVLSLLLSLICLFVVDNAVKKISKYLNRQKVCRNV